MDPAFVGFLENQVRTGLLDGISGTQALLRREQDKLAGYRRQLEDIDNRFGPLRVEIQKAKQDALGLANQVVTDAELALVSALRELDKAIEELANLATGLLRQQLDQANRDFSKANNDLNAALAEVNRINGAIA
jgi:predicted  nucleic acid-binding Zn-ribbon protein